jgi:hypothetical protein
MHITPSAQRALPPTQRALHAQDLHSLGHLLPGSARELLGCVGLEAALLPLNTWPGITLKLPKSATHNSHGARRWQQLEALIGLEATTKLIAQFGGYVIEINTCFALRCERRRRWLRSGFDMLTTGPGGLSKNHAVEQLGIELARTGDTMSNRAIEQAIDASDPAGNPLSLNFCLFD